MRWKQWASQSWALMSAARQAVGQRIVVVGTTGSGRTTFAQQIATLIDAPHVELVALSWELDWTQAAAPVFRARVRWGLCRGAACLALGNYHNAGPRNRVRAETIHLGDLEGLVQLFQRLITEISQYDEVLPALRQRYERGAGSALAELRRTRGRIS